MNNYLADVGEKLHEQFNDDTADNTYQNIYNLIGDNDDIIFTHDDVIACVYSIDVNKSSGIDFLPTFVLKDCFEVLIVQLTYLFNQSIALGTFPDCWKVATITPIPKSGDLNLVKNWRPISIIPLIGKMMEKLCNNILNCYLDNMNILCDEQYGFRKGRSTSLAIFNYVKFITEEINRQNLVGSIYIDLARAFDSINHVRLIDKLTDMGVPVRLVMWIEDYLSKRSICTKLNNCTSSTRDLLCGVPQGSILGPTLFLCYINDLASITRNLGTRISLYADDAVIFCNGQVHSNLKLLLEKSLSAVHKWCNVNFINVNVQKTKFCIYGNRSNVKAFKDTSICADRLQILKCHQYNYLGVLLDECMTLVPNFNSIFKKYSYKIFQFGKIRRYLDIQTRILVYKQTIMPLVEYVSFMLYLNNVKETEKLQKLQNRCLRMCLNINNPRDMSVLRLHETSRVNFLDIRRYSQLLNIMFMLKCNNVSQKVSVRNTRNADRYIFNTDIVHKEVYARSPYYKGVTLWNNLPIDLQNQTIGLPFKICLKKHLGLL